jgi:hypothetical protein
MLKNRMKFIALTLVFAFLLSGCSTKKNRQEWNSYNENEEWSYFMPEDVDRDVVPFLFPGKYVIGIEIEIQNEFKTYIERYTELETCKLLFYDIDRGTVQKKVDCKRILEEYLQDYQIAEEQIIPCLYQQNNCVCVILEKIGYRKSSGDPLPKIGIIINVDTEKIIGEVSEMDFEKYHLLYKNEETESITEEFLAANNLLSMKVVYYHDFNIYAMQMHLSDIYSDAEIFKIFPELKEVSAEKNKTICFYAEESKIEKIMKQFLPKKQEITCPKANTNEMKVIPRV